jgi:anti-anti-sigma factor
MQVTAESYGHAVILNLKGELSEDSLAAFKQSVDHHLVNSQVVDLILNMQQVPFVDSVALECLLDLQDKLGERLGQVKLIDCDPNVLKILEITHLANQFEILQDINDAIKSTRV